MLVHAFYEPCPECHAPWIKHLPAGWTLTVRRKKRRNGPHVQWARVHVPDCPSGFQPKEVPSAES